MAWFSYTRLKMIEFHQQNVFQSCIDYLWSVNIYEPPHPLSHLSNCYINIYQRSEYMELQITNKNWKEGKRTPRLSSFALSKQTNSCICSIIRISNFIKISIIVIWHSASISISTSHTLEVNGKIWLALQLLVLDSMKKQESGTRKFQLIFFLVNCPTRQSLSLSIWVSTLIV